MSPTDNAAEQTVRPAVISRKTSFGTLSERGSRFLERMLAYAATLKRAGRSLHEFVLGVARATVAGTAPPTLIQ